jgi:hypothetical protein
MLFGMVGDEGRVVFAVGEIEGAGEPRFDVCRRAWPGETAEERRSGQSAEFPHGLNREFEEPSDGFRIDGQCADG